MAVEQFLVVPAHDQRDFDFAKKYNLEIIKVVSDKNNNKILSEAYTGDGILINSDFLNNLNIQKAKEVIIDRIEKKKNWKEKNTISFKRLGYI